MPLKFSAPSADIVLMDDYHSTRADEVAAIDPLGVAEEITGQSYKDDKGTMGLGFLILQDTNAKLKALRQEACDTYMGCSPDAMRSVLVELGATLQYAEKYIDHEREERLIDEGYRDEAIELDFEVWAHESEGWLVTFDTYGRTDEVVINSANIYCNILQLCEGEDNWRDAYDVVRGGSGTTNVRQGDHVDVFERSWDARDGLKSLVMRLRSGVDAGLISFLREWVHCRVWHLAPYTAKGADHKVECERIAAELPEWIQRNLVAENYVPINQLKDIGKL